MPRHRDGRYRRKAWGEYRARPEVSPGQHGIASDATFWQRWFAARQHEEDAETAAIDRMPRRRARGGYEE